MGDVILSPTPVEVPATTRLINHRADGTLHPATGNKFAVLYIEATPGNAAAANALLAQARGLAVYSKMIQGTATADAGRRASVNVQVTQLSNAPLE